MRIFDAHTHLSAEAFPNAADFYQLAVASTPEDCAFLWEKSRTHPRLYCACGLHPWHSEDQTIEVLLPYFETCCAIGEIGMDSVWCEIDLGVQRAVFCQQLELADALKKPLVLHTKGCEREVLRELPRCSQAILVHWYSCPDHLEAYIKRDCFFSVGPDLGNNLAVQALVRRVQTQRLVLESDGVSALSWALARDCSPQELPDFLRTQISAIAQIKGCAEEIIAESLFENTLHFLGLSL